MGRIYKNIMAWQLANQLTKLIYKATKKFPREELYGLSSQLRRATLSVPCNIVEGSSRGTDKEYVRFLYIAKGSLSETEYLLYLSDGLGSFPRTVILRNEVTRDLLDPSALSGLRMTSHIGNTKETTFPKIISSLTTRVSCL